MGKTVKKAAPVETSSDSLIIKLSDLGMTALHKVGLAGLWMTLRALEKDEQAKERLEEAGGSWNYTATSVSLSWNGTPELFFRTLFEESFKIDKNGLFWFPALGSPTDHIQHAVILQV